MAIFISNGVKSIVDRPDKMDVHFSSKYTEWQTPRKLYDYFDREYDFSVDVACTTDNCLADLGFFFDKGFDGLKEDWLQTCESHGYPKTCFMNPPHGRGLTEKWVKKAWEEAERGVTTVCLLPARPDTNWFQNYCAHGDVIFLAGRLKFYDPSKPVEKRKYDKHGNEILDPAPFPSCIVVFSPNSWPGTVYWPGSRGMFD